MHRNERRGAWRERVHERLGDKPWRHWFFGGRRFAAWWAHQEAESMNPLVTLFLSRGGGLLPVFVLHYLSQEPRYGNDIMRKLEDRTEGTWLSNPGSVYPLLRAMERRGLVEGRWEDAVKRTRRTYHLTDKGRQEYERIRELMRPGFYEALHILHSLYDELYEPNQDRTKAD